MKGNQQSKRSNRILINAVLSHFDLVTCILFALLSFLLVLYIPEGNPARAVISLTFIVLVPGYLFTTFFWPMKGDLSLQDRGVLSLVLSVLIAIFLGLILHLIWEITAVALTTSYLAFSIAAAMISLFFRSKIPREERYALELPAVLRSQGKDRLVTVGIVVALIISSLIIYSIAVTPRSKEGYTELYMLDESGGLNDLPKELRVNEEATVLIHVGNREGKSMNYTLEVSLVNNGTGHVALLDSYDLGLETDGSDEREISFNVAENGTYVLRVLLMKHGEVGDSLEIHRWIDVDSGG